MADTLSKERRSWLMGRVAQKNTKPEMIVRRLMHGLGYRYRLHRKDLPGRPDIVLPKHRKVIFVHGCFWHRHDCKKATMPKTNEPYWIKKFEENVERDKRAVDDLVEQGWKSMIVWECQTRDLDALADRVDSFLGRRP